MSLTTQGYMSAKDSNNLKMNRDKYKEHTKYRYININLHCKNKEVLKTSYFAAEFCIDTAIIYAKL